MQTQLNLARARQNDVIHKIRHRELVDRASFEGALFRLARRLRDQLLTAPTRHAAILAAKHHLPPAVLAAALDQILRATLIEISRRPRSPSPAAGSESEKF